MAADQIGAKKFVSPRQERIKVSELLDALEADYRLRGKHCPQFKSHLAHIHKHFASHRAVEIARNWWTPTSKAGWLMVRGLPA